MPSSELAGGITAFGAAALLCFLFTPYVRAWARRVGAVDLPDPRKVHEQPVPRLGGLSVAAAVVVVSLLALALSPQLRDALAEPISLRRSVAFVAAWLTIVGLGALDDTRGLPARLKLLIEIAAASLVVVAAPATSVELLPGVAPVQLPIIGSALAVFWIVAITNAVNMLDVVDGVAAGVSAIAALSLAAVSLAVGGSLTATLLLAIAGAAIGFLPHNFSSVKKIFLGDSGSLSLGFALGALSVIMIRRDGVWLLIPAALALALPLLELGLTVLRRTLQAVAVGRRDNGLTEQFVFDRGRIELFVPDRRHVPHRLLELGLNRRDTLAALFAVAAAGGVLAFATVRWAWLGPLGALIALAVLINFAPRWLYAELRLLEKGALLPLFESRIVSSRALQASFDLTLLVLAYLAAEAMLASVGSRAVNDLAARTVTSAVAGWLGLWTAGLYRASYRHAGLAEGLRVTRAAILGTVLAAGAQTLLFGVPGPLALWLIHLLLVLAGVTCARFAFRVLEHLHQFPEAGRRVLIFGAGRGGDLALRELKGNPALNLEPIAFVDDDQRKWGRQFHGLTVHSGRELPILIEGLSVEAVLLSTPRLSKERRSSIERACQERGVPLYRLDLRLHAMNGDGAQERGVEHLMSVAHFSAQQENPL